MDEKRDTGAGIRVDGSDKRKRPSWCDRNRDQRDEDEEGGEGYPDKNWVVGLPKKVLNVVGYGEGAYSENGFKRVDVSLILVLGNGTGMPTRLHRRRRE